jgi:predicted transcriptional regulator
LINNRRSEIEIINEILNLSIKGVRKTEILYQGNMSYSQLKSYLPYLIDKNIVEEYKVNNNGNSTTMYKTTHKGLELLESIRKILINFE